MEAGAFTVDSVPVWDGSKFVPSPSTGLVTAFGGLYEGSQVDIVADGSAITDWDETLPTGAPPKQVAVNQPNGTLRPQIDGVYRLDTTLSVNNLDNNVVYEFFFIVNGAPQAIVASIEGDIQQPRGNVSLSVLTNIDALAFITVGANSATGAATFDIVSATFLATRVG
jgi:hypothetical protein